MHKLFSKQNFIILAISSVVIILGYILLAQGPVDNPLSITWAPLLLIAGYCILVPIAILFKEKEEVKKK